MKKIIILAAALSMVSFTQQAGLEDITAHSEQKAAVNDKAFLIRYYHETFSNLEKNVAGLNEKQLQFKPSEEQWSISQNLEHIVITEKMLFDMAKSAMAQPANPERKSELKFTDEDLVKGVSDRSHKVKAPEILHGKGLYNDPVKALEDLRKQRQEILDYLEAVSLEDLRDHISDSPFGPTDTYQSFLFIAGHTARHTFQIEEIKTNPGFPK